MLNLLQSVKIKRERNDDTEASEHLLANNPSYRSSKPALTKFSLFILLLTGTLLGVSLTTIYFILIRRCPIAQDRNAALKETSYWSPILDDIEIPMKIEEMNGTVWPLVSPPFTREPPSAENDALWTTIAEPRAFPLTREDIIKLGRDPDKVAKFDNDHWGLGDNAYMAELDVRHVCSLLSYRLDLNADAPAHHQQIHCLNMLRKHAFINYPGYQPELNDLYSQGTWIHLNHCVDMILQGIKCSKNTDLYTLAWIEDRKLPWPDFNINRKCPDFSTIEKWDREHAVDDNKWDDLPLPKDAYVWPAPWSSEKMELGFKLGKHSWRNGYEFKKPPSTDEET